MESLIAAAARALEAGLDQSDTVFLRIVLPIVRERRPRLIDPPQLRFSMFKCAFFFPK
jgi:hypothetical protein